eukprot:TRINITY_DN7136_c0_g2_i1.p4 TRINITY_DN7136_c0_g2~~TRINITY_DN7136_c0_g2_i1.p4  ORF type:complete len:111 (+),score=2.33 TRINITY_DN7136_c0_g2_i1:258-590(+)
MQQMQFHSNFTTRMFATRTHNGKKIVQIYNINLYLLFIFTQIQIQYKQNLMYINVMAQEKINLVVPQNFRKLGLKRSVLLEKLMYYVEQQLQENLNMLQVYMVIYVRNYS